MSNIDKVYLASSFKLKGRINRVAEALRAADIEIADVWWDESKEQADLKTIDMPDEEWYADETIIQRADRHFEAIEDSDALVIVCPPFGETKKFNGANVELGYALALDLPLFSVGRLERSAMYYPVTQTDSAAALVEALEGHDA